MANDNLNFWCENASHLGATFYASGLDGKISDYSSFSIVVEQNGITIMEFVLLSSAATNPSSSGFSLEMYNDEHLGYNIFSPGCDYTAYLDCYRDDELYSISDGFDFSTPDITPPSSEDINPDVFATVRDQGDYDTCVADSLACAMEIFKMRTANVNYEVYSTAYIYGTDNDGEEGMYNNEAIDNCYSHGSPRWEISTGTFPDSMWENEAAELFYDLKNDTTIYKHAKKQSFGQKASSCNVDFYDCDSVADAIETNGYFMFNFRIPDNFYDIDDSGIIPQPDEYTGVNHSMALIGLTTIDNKKYWIAQNSWGESWGDNGLCYVPYDWGCGVQSPLYKTDSGNKSPEFDTSVTSWTTDCYAPSPGDGYADYNDSSPYNIYAELVEDSQREVYLTWDSDVPDCKYFVLARQRGTDKWYIKATTTDTFVSVFVDEYDTYEFMIISCDIGYHCSPQSEIFEIKVIDVLSPTPWEWESPMTGELEVVMSDILGCPVVRPVTALEWDDFRARVNEIREYQGVDPYPFQYDTLGNSNSYGSNEETEFIPAIYNEAAKAIRELTDYLINIGFDNLFTEDDINSVSDIDENTILSASLFTGLRDVLNKCM